ncbi:hypothetical protein M758_UG254800 [Ceratodon purpureus]|nr:hypothetical protein M758_UG254800 [Ceratodon purpureus]
MTDETLREMIWGTLICLIDQRENCGDKEEALRKRRFYHADQYIYEDSFGELSNKLHEHE